MESDGVNTTRQADWFNIAQTTSRYPADSDWSAKLNSKYTFDDFVAGACNRFAHSAALAVAERRSSAYSPLFLCGGTGMGKTHLIHAIGHSMRRSHPRSVAWYISSEKFANDMVSCKRNDLMASFRNKFRNLDVLLIDDVQFLADKQRTEEELFHTFDSLHESAKQIVIASDRPPKQLPGIEDRLRSRFGSGLIADIQPPDLQTKIAILYKKAAYHGACLSPDLALYIASGIQTNVRELEGALIRLIAYCSFTGAEPSLATARHVLNAVINSQAPKVTMAAIQKTVAEWFGIDVNEIKAKSNSRCFVLPRQVAMFLAKQMTRASLPEIGRQFGGKHHSTVAHSVERIEKQCAADKALKDLVSRLGEALLR